MSKYRCVENPDCFNCPFSDCKATMKDLNRQEVYQTHLIEVERNKKIVNLFVNEKVKIKELATRFSLSQPTIRKLLREEGVYDRKRHSENIQKCKSTK